MKNESVVFIPRNEEEKKKEDQVHFSCEGNDGHFSTKDQSINEDRQKYHKRSRSQKRIIRILSCTTLLCFTLLLASIGVIVYLVVNNSLKLTELPAQTTVAVTSGYQFTTPLSYESTTAGVTVEQNTTTTTSNKINASQVTHQPSSAPDPDPIVFVPGKFTFPQAAKACLKMDRKLALKGDMEKAFQKGYERCQYGWMGDSHAGYVMQESGARLACGGGVIGLIYTPYKDPQSVVGGAYCAPKDEISKSEFDVQSFTHNKSINWWVTMDPADIYDLKYLMQMGWQNASYSSQVTKRREGSIRLLKSFRVVYPCCNFLNITKARSGNSTVVEIRIPAGRMKTLVETYKKEFKHSELAVYPHLKASYEALIEHGAATFNRSHTIDDIVAKAVLSGIDGLVMEYEPHTDYTRQHAEIYRDFVDELHEKLSQHGLKLGILISSWGILKYYDVYSRSNVEIIGSMASTYHGHNITSNMHHVNEMLKWIDLDRLQIGIGAMYVRNHVKSAKSFGWNQKQLRLFIDWLKRKGVNHLHVWPIKWGATRWVERYFMDSIVSFTK